MNRRELLTRATAAMAVPVVAVAAPALAKATVENPEILALGKRLPEVEAIYQGYLTAYHDAVATWGPQWPVAPKECLIGYCKETEGDIERNLEGDAIIRKGEKHYYRVFNIKGQEGHIEWLLDLIDHARRKNERSRAKRKPFGPQTFKNWDQELRDRRYGLSVLPAHLAEVRRIKDASNIRSIKECRSSSAASTIAFARIVMETPSHTAAGLKVKAEAAAMIGRMDQHDMRFALMMDDMKTQRQSFVVLLGEAVSAIA